MTDDGFTAEQREELASLKQLPLEQRVELLERDHIRQSDLMNRATNAIAAVAQTLGVIDQTITALAKRVPGGQS